MSLKRRLSTKFRRGNSPSPISNNGNSNNETLAAPSESQRLSLTLPNRTHPLSIENSSSSSSSSSGSSTSQQTSPPSSQLKRKTLSKKFSNLGRLRTGSTVHKGPSPLNPDILGRESPLNLPSNLSSYSLAYSMFGASILEDNEPVPPYFVDNPVKSVFTPPTNLTLCKTSTTIRFLDQFYSELFLRKQLREQRRSEFQAAHNNLLNKPANEMTKEQTKIVAQHLLKETQYLSRLRARVTMKDFCVLNVFARGSFGEILLVRENSSKRLFALKKLRKSALTLEKQINHVIAERTVMACFDPPNPWIVTLQYAFQDKHYLFLVMDYIPGGDLLGLLIKYDTFSETQTQFYLVQLILALEDLHLKGYIHRDLKPDNVLIRADGNIVLSDFGLSTKGEINFDNPYYQLRKSLSQSPSLIQSLDSDSSSSLSTGDSSNNQSSEFSYLQYLKSKNRRSDAVYRRVRSRSVVGTPDYMAPEIFRCARDKSLDYGPVVDFWSLGAIMFEMLYGYPPFASETDAETCHNILRYRKYLYFPPETPISPACLDLLRRLLTGPSSRIGRNGIQEIKNHPFFKGIDWKKPFNLRPPFIPKVKNETDTSNFSVAEYDDFVPNFQHDTDGEITDGAITERTANFQDLLAREVSNPESSVYHKKRDTFHGPLDINNEDLTDAQVEMAAELKGDFGPESSPPLSPSPMMGSPPPKDSTEVPPFVQEQDTQVSEESPEVDSPRKTKVWAKLVQSYKSKRIERKNKRIQLDAIQRDAMDEKEVESPPDESVSNSKSLFSVLSPRRSSSPKRSESPRGNRSLKKSRKLNKLSSSKGTTSLPSLQKASISNDLPPLGPRPLVYSRRSMETVRVMTDPLPRLKIYSPFYSFINSQTKADFCFAGFSYDRCRFLGIPEHLLYTIPLRKQKTVEIVLSGADLDHRYWIKHNGELSYWINYATGLSTNELPPSIASQKLKSRQRSQSQTTSSSPNRTDISPPHRSPAIISITSSNGTSEKPPSPIGISPLFQSRPSLDMARGSLLSKNETL